MFSLLIGAIGYAQGLPSYNADGAPVGKRDEKRFAHFVVDQVTFNTGADSISITLRTAPTQSRRPTAFSSSTSYVVVCMNADSVQRVSGSQFRIWYATALRGKTQMYIAVGN